MGMVCVPQRPVESGTVGENESEVGRTDASAAAHKGGSVGKATIGSLEVSVVGLGCNNFGWRMDAPATARVVDSALDAGINFLDTADIYGNGQSEEFLGQALKGRWDRVVIATKFGSKMDDQRQGAKPDYIRRAVEDSLRRLGTERIDLYQLHRPDPNTPVAETLEALDGLVRSGKVREIGSSNFSAEQIREADGAVREGAARFNERRTSYRRVRRFLPALLQTVTFGASPAGQPLIEAIGYLKAFD